MFQICLLEVITSRIRRTSKLQKASQGPRKGEQTEPPPAEPRPKALGPWVQGFDAFYFLICRFLLGLGVLHQLRPVVRPVEVRSRGPSNAVPMKEARVWRSSDVGYVGDT